MYLGEPTNNFTLAQDTSDLQGVSRFDFTGKTGQLASDAPSSFSDVWEKSRLETERLVNTFSVSQRREEVADKRIETVRKLTGVELENPYRISFIGAEQAKSNAPYAGGTAVDFFKGRLKELAEKYPQFASQIDPRDIEADDKELGRQSALATQRAMEMYGPGWSKYVAEFGGGMHGMLSDPVNLGTMFIGAAGTGRAGIQGLLRMAFYNAAANAGVEAAFQPFVMQRYQDVGLEYSGYEAALNVAMAGVLGGGLDLGVRGATRAIRRGRGQEPVLDEKGRVSGWKKKGDPDPITPEVAQKLQDGDLETVKKVAKDYGVDEDPALRGAIAEAENTEALIRSAKESGMEIDDGEGMRKLAQALRSVVDDAEPPPVLTRGEPEYFDPVSNERMTRQDIDAIVDMRDFVAEVNKRPKPRRLVEFLRRELQGVRDEAGDVRNILGRSQDRPGLVNSRGATLDDAAQSAWDAGYLPGTSRPTINDLLEAIDDDINGGGRYSVNDGDAVEDIRIAQEMEQDLDELGVAGLKQGDEIRAYFARTSDEGAGTGAADFEDAGDQFDRFARQYTTNPEQVERAANRLREQNPKSSAEARQIVGETLQEGTQEATQRAIFGAHRVSPEITEAQTKLIRELNVAPEVAEALATPGTRGNHFLTTASHAIREGQSAKMAAEALEHRISKTLDEDGLPGLTRQDAEPRGIDELNSEQTRQQIEELEGRVQSDVPSGDRLLFAISAQQAAQRFEQAASVDSLGYYSKAVEAAKGIKQAKGTPEQMLAQLKKAGVKQSEIDATGLEDFLEGQKSVTRDGIVAFLELQRVPVREATYYSGQTPFEEAGDEVFDNPAKWQSYSLDPSNPTYKETVLHLPAQSKAVDPGVYEGQAARVIETAERSLPPEHRLPAHFTTRERVENLNTFADRNPSIQEALEEYRRLMSAADDTAHPYYDGPDFRSGHFGEPNAISHLRTSIQPDADGKSNFVINELQSDWGQKIRDSGGVRDEAKIADLTSSLNDAVNRLNDIWSGRDIPNSGRGSLEEAVWIVPKDERPDGMEAISNEVRRLRSELRTAEDTASGHPLVNTTDQWVNTSLRRALRQAVEADADYIAIASGETVDGFGMGAPLEGLKYAYNEMYPKKLRDIIKKLDKDAAKPEHLDKLKAFDNSHDRGDGFTRFPLTDKLKKSVMEKGQPLFAIRAFHGSPHDFDQFDISKIGRGEGAQAFGHGLYFTETLGIAEGYKDKLTRNRSVTIDGEAVQVVTSDTGASGAASNPKIAKDYVLNQFSLLFDADSEVRMSKVKQKIQDDIEYWKKRVEGEAHVSSSVLAAIGFGSEDRSSVLKFGDGIVKDREAALRAAEDLDGRVGIAEGTVYEVEIDVDKDQLLDWDKMSLSEKENLSDPSYVQELANKGLAGIKYFDGMSRTSQEGTYNFVIFDDTKIKITKKNGKPVTPQERQQVLSDTQKVFAARAGMTSMGDPGAKALTPFAAREMPSIQREIDKIVRRLPKGYRLELEDRLVFRDGGRELEADAYTDPYEQLIKVSLATNDPGRFARHEEIHAYKQLGLFSDEEWNTLTRYAADNDLRTQYDIDGRYKDLYEPRHANNPDKLEEMLVEEMVAEMWADRIGGQSFGGAVNRIIDRIQRFLRRIAEMLGGKGYLRVEDVYQRIESGEIGRRADVRDTMQQPFSNPQEALAYAINNHDKDPITPGLDMSQEARMQRARDMGFDTDNVLYHGTTRGFSEFDLNAPKRTDDGFYGRGVYFGKTPSEAEYYVDGADNAQVGAYFAKGNRLEVPNDGADIDGFMKWSPVLDELGLLDETGRSAYQSALKETDPVARINAYVEAGGPSKVSASGFREPFLLDEYLRKHSSPQEFSEAVQKAGYSGVDVGGEVVIFDPSNIRSVNAAFDPAREGSSNLMYSFAGERARTANRQSYETEMSAISRMGEVGDVVEACRR